MTQTNETVDAVVEAVTNSQENLDEVMQPIFDEIKEMNADGAVNVLIQAAQQAQKTGSLTLRDAVIVAQAISILRPGSI
jgi:hypothetical protein